MYKNAGIKTIREAITRLINGEVFYYEGGRIYFNDEFKAGNPFRYEDEILSGVFEYIDEWQTKIDWRDYVSAENPVLCFVWNENFDERIPNLVIGYSPGWSFPYKGLGDWYANAEKMTREEALKYIAGE